MSRESVQPQRRMARHCARPLDLSADALLRHLYQIREFTDDPNCLLRLAIKQAGTPLRLSDGTRIMPGDPIGELHLWNDHVPPFSVRQADARLGETGARLDGAFAIPAG